MTEMHNEVIEAVLEYYKDDEDAAADCLVYLASLKCLPLAMRATLELESMNRCYDCGCKLQSCTYQEYHTEVDEPPFYKTVTDWYCPQCDIRSGGYYE